MIIEQKDSKTIKMDEKQTIDQFNESVTRKAVIRYLTIIVDLSLGSLNMEMLPNKSIVIKKLLSEFIAKFAE